MNKVTPWIGVYLEKLIVSQLVKKLPEGALPWPQVPTSCL
jgi:hypothetical protein